MAGARLNRGRRALLLAAFLAASAVAAGPASAAERAVPPRHGQVILFLVDRVSFEQVLSVPEFRGLARAGGAALMATSPAGGAGASMADALRAGGVQLCTVGDPPKGGPARVLSVGPGGSGDCALGTLPGREPLIADGGELRRALAKEVGGRDSVLVVDVAETHRRGVDEADASSEGERSRPAALVSAGKLLSRIVEAVGGRRMLVMAATLSPSDDMNRVGDEVTPLVMAEGNANELFSRNGPLRALASGTTRQVGLVASVDIAPTVLDFFGLPRPTEMDGSAIRFTTAEAPFELHRRHLEHRRIRFPIQIAQLAFVSVAGLVAIIALLLHARRPVSPRVRAGLRFLALCGLALPIAVLGGGALPRLTYAVVVPFVVLSVLLVAGLSLVAGPPRTMWPVVFVGVLGLSLAVLDAALGGHALRMPLVGGTMFDGVRFYGLPNAFIALVLAGALIAAAPLHPVPGTVLLVAAGLFAGFPHLGANIGASITLFAAAGLWSALRTRRRLGVRELFVAAGVTLIGLAVVLLANIWLPGAPTHATRFVERTGGGLGEAWRVIGDRLAIGFRQLADAPAALIPLLGLVATLVVVLRQPGRIGRALRRHEAWRDALVVLTASSIVAYFVNDTGLAAAAPGFLYAMSLLTYLAFLPQPHSDAMAFAEWLEERALAR